jgi:hypothetical protein
MAVNRSKFNAWVACIAMLGTCITAEISLAEDQPAAEVSAGTPATPAGDSATAWDKTRQGSTRAWDKTKEVSGNAWNATREGTAKAWDKTKEVSGNAWAATREGSTRAWNKTKTTVQGWGETKPESETHANQETPAPD